MSVVTTPATSVACHAVMRSPASRNNRTNSGTKATSTVNHKLPSGTSVCVNTAILPLPRFQATKCGGLYPPHRNPHVGSGFSGIRLQPDWFTILRRDLGKRCRPAFGSNPDDADTRFDSHGG